VSPAKAVDPLPPLDVVVRVVPSTGKVEMLSLSPTRPGSLRTTESEYEIEFPASKNYGRVHLKVNRYTGEGAYEVGDSGTATLFYLVQCEPFRRDRL
jgi:hypothetical protein